LSAASCSDGRWCVLIGSVIAGLGRSGGMRRSDTGDPPSRAGDVAS
jgi:hypothetical protein